ncbi:MAG: HAD family hydrolase [Planctomycetaceae bacterium]
MTNYAAWLIDLDGTLYRSLPVKVAMGIELCFAGRRVRRVIRAFRREHEALRASELLSDTSPFEVQLARTAERLGCPIAEVRTIVEDWMIARPGRWLRRFRRRELLAEIARFRAGGGRTALVSDYPARVKLAALDATKLFDVVIANGESLTPYRLKPSPQAFVSAANQLGLRCDECLVLGDRLDADGMAAQQAGMAFRRIR